MTYFVTEKFIKCKYTDCIEVCPTDAFREGPNFLAIDADDCIDCNLCVPECPVDAIFEETEVPEQQHAFIALNIELASEWPVISRPMAPLPAADYWATVDNKLSLLEL